MNRTIYSVLIIIIISLVTIVLRVGPAKLFPPEKETPPLLVYLGKTLPMAVIGMLIVYCYRLTDFSDPHSFIPIVAAGLVAIISYLIKRSTVISILFSTLIYMFLIQGVFN